MKILYINAMGATDQAPLGGVFVSHRIKALRKLGVEVYPVSLAIDYSIFTKFLLRKRGYNIPDCLLDEQIGVKYQTISVKFSFYHTLKAKINVKIYDRLTKKEFLKKIKDIDSFDIMHIHWFWPCGCFLPDLSRRKNIPYVITCHGSEINITLKKKKIQSYMLEILEGASKVEFVSNALLECAKKCGYSGNNATVVYNGIDTDVFYKRDIKKKKKVVGYVGNLILVKGADRLSKIFEKLYEIYHDKIEFIVVGDGTLMENIKEETRHFPVRFTGRLEPNKVAEQYSIMDVLVVPSRSEGYPCAIKEAQACGTFVVGNDVGGVKEAIGEYGLVVQGDDEENIIDKIVTAICNQLDNWNSKEYRKMMDCAYECSWEKRQEKALENYNAILIKN